MATVDLDDELARFEAELKALEQQPDAVAAVSSSDAAASKKRAREDDSETQADEPSRKRPDTDTGAGTSASATAGSTSSAAATAPLKPSGLGSGGLAKPVTTETVVIRAAPKIYMAPPRPAPVKKTYDPSATTVAPPPRPSSVSTSSASASALTTRTSAVSGTAPTASVRPGVANTIAEVFARRGALSGFPAGVTGEHASRTVPLHMSATAAPMPPLPLLVPRFDPVTGQYVSPEEQQLVMQQQSVYEYDPNRPLTSTTTTLQQQHSESGGAAAAAAPADGTGKPKKPKKLLRVAGGELWEDQTLADWPDNDFRLFCGDLGNEVSDEVLAHSFSRYASFQRARVVRDKYTHKSRGYGFVSFADPLECARALREMNGKYIGNRPVKLTKSRWQDRNIDVAKKKMKKKNRHLFT